MSLISSISVDLEEFYHAQNLSEVAPRNTWDSLPSRVEYGTNIILDLLAKYQRKITFFILAQVAKKNKSLIKRIHQEGHEIASHGLNHFIVYNQSKEEFRRDVSEAKNIIEEIIGEEILGYRAPNFSITDKSHWAYEILVDCGYKYDSSVYPTYHSRYTNYDKEIIPYELNISGSNIIIAPLSVYQIKLGNLLKLNYPVAGGAYWRIFPFFINKFLMKRIYLSKKQSLNLYLHPWELDQDQPRFNGLNLNHSIRHYYGYEKMLYTLEYCLKNFELNTVKNHITSHGFKL